MVVKIYGNIAATCTQRVLTVAKELGVPYELITVSLASGETKTEEYLKTRQPFGQIPSIVDEDGFKLFESRAICRYLADTYGNGKLVPKDTKGKALFEQAASIEQAQFDPSVSELVMERVFKPMYGRPTDVKQADAHQEKLEAKLQGYEIILSKQKYLAGDEITLADIFHLPYGWMATERVGVKGLKSDSLPNVKRWWADITSRDSWKAVQADLARALGSSA